MKIEKTNPYDLAFTGGLGMTKREYLASAALPAMLEKLHDTNGFDSIAKEAVAAADALIKALNSSTGEEDTDGFLQRIQKAFGAMSDKDMETLAGLASLDTDQLKALLSLDVDALKSLSREKS